MELPSVRQGGKLRYHELRVRPIPDSANDIQRDRSRAIPDGCPDPATHSEADATANGNSDASAATGSAALAAVAAVRRPATCSRAGADEAALLAGSEPNSRADLE